MSLLGRDNAWPPCPNVMFTSPPFPIPSCHVDVVCSLRRELATPASSFAPEGGIAAPVATRCNCCSK